MKKLLILLLMSFSITVCGQANSNEYKTIFSKDSILVDVRTEREYMDGHLKNAINIPYNLIKSKIKEIAPDKKQTIAVYCRSGRRSGIAEMTLKNLGYTNIINAGRFKDLKKIEEKEKQ